MATILKDTLEVISKIKNGKNILDGYMEGDIVELFEVLVTNNKINEFTFLTSYMYSYNIEILEYMKDNYNRFGQNSKHNPPYSAKPYCDIINSALKS